jgi:hypothetical protein
MGKKFGTGKGPSASLPQSIALEKHLEALKSDVKDATAKITKELGALHARLASGKLYARLVALYARQRLSAGTLRYVFINDGLPRDAISRMWAE